MEGFKYFIQIILVSPSQVRVRRRNGVWTFLAGCILQVNCVLVAARLARAPDEAVRANAFFFNEMVDNCVNPIPAKLLCTFVRFAVSNHSYAASCVIAESLSNTCEQRFSVIAQGY